MKRTRKIFSLVLAVMMILSILPIHAAASGEGTYDIAAPGGVITAEKGTISGGKAADGAILSIALDPAAFPAYTFDHWESAYGDVIPQESFRVLVDKDAYFFPVFADAAPHFGEWTLVKAGESCEDGDLYMRTDPESGLVEYSFRLFNYGNHAFGEYEYYDEEYCAATCSHCGYVDLIEHNWSEETVVREATHSVPGLTRKTCYRCGKTIDTEIPVTSNHSWGAWEIVTPSVNGQPGVRRHTCTECSASEECWYIKADWKGYYDDSRITFTGNYNNQYGSMKEGHYSFINNDGKRAYVYGASWADKNAERVVMFMWIDDPDELGRRPIYHAKTMVNGWGYGWALLAYVDTFDEYISFIDNLYLDRSTVPHGSSLFNMFREYEDVYNEACLPASGSSDFFASQSYWSYDSDSTVSRGSTDIPVKVYTNTNGYVMYVDPETNTCLYYAQRTPNMSLYINSMTALVSDADYAAMTDDEKENVIPYSELRKTIAYDTENTTHSIWQEYLDKPQPRYFHIVVQGANTEEYAANPGYDDPKGYYDVYSVDYIETYHLTSDLAGGGYYTHGYHIHDFGIAGTIQYPQNWYSNQNYAIDIKPEEPDGWAFDHWEKYNWQTGTWDLFTEVNGEGKPCLNYSEVNADKTAFTIDHRLTDIAIVRARFVEVPAETVHVKVTGGTFSRIANGTTYYFESEGDVPVGSLICPIDDYDAVPAGKQFDHWIMKVDGVETEIEWQTINYNKCVTVTADTEFVAVYTDRTYWLDVWAENGTVYLDGEEYWGGEYPADTALTLTTEGSEGYPHFYGWYLMGDKDEEKPGSGGNALLGNDTTLHYKTTAGYATILAKWGDTETPPEVPADFHDITVVNGFLSTFYHEIQTDGLKLSAMRVPNYSNIDVYPDPMCGLIVDRFEMTGDLNGSPYTENVELDSEYGFVSFWIRDCESTPQILTITGIGVPEIAPEFMVQSLVLSGQLGVNFFMDLSMLSDEEKAASYMEFTVNSKTTKADFDSSFRDAGGKGYYGFTCYVSSIQMADEITAVFHYGEGKTVEKTYSVKEYLETLESMDLDAKTETLAHAIADYGYYAQPYLAEVNNWTVGTDHAKMDMHYTEAAALEAVYDAIKAEVADKAFDKTFNETHIREITYSLNFSAETKINVYFAPQDGYEVDASITVGDQTYRAVRQADGRYKLTIPNLSAHRLGDMFTISGKVMSGGEEKSTVTVHVSALSYVRSILNKTETDEETALWKQTVAAFYRYYKAAIHYNS